VEQELDDRMWALKKNKDAAACANGTNRLYGSLIKHRRNNAITSKHGGIHPESRGAEPWT